MTRKLDLPGVLRQGVLRILRIVTADRQGKAGFFRSAKEVKLPGESCIPERCNLPLVIWHDLMSGKIPRQVLSVVERLPFSCRVHDTPGRKYGLMCSPSQKCQNYRRNLDYHDYGSPEEIHPVHGFRNSRTGLSSVLIFPVVIIWTCEPVTFVYASV